MIDDNFPKYVVSMEEYKIPTNEGIEHISAWELEKHLVKTQNIFVVAPCPNDRGVFFYLEFCSNLMRKQMKFASPFSFFTPPSVNFFQYTSPLPLPKCDGGKVVC